MTERFQRLRAAYEAARAEPDPVRRERLLVEACGDDPALLAELRAMLAADPADDFLRGDDRGMAGVEPGPPPNRLGEFELVQPIGSGGSGTVWLARQPSLDRNVALKVMTAGPGTPAALIDRFHREPLAVASLSHPHIVPVFAEGRAGDTHWFAMQLVDGHGLDVELRLQRERRPNDPELLLPSFGSGQWYAAVARLCADAADALQKAHEQGIVHRDVKPPNLLLDRGGRVLVADFGIARDDRFGSLTETGTIAGTWHYMSPEQARIAKLPVDHRTDVYSLGVTLYELATLHHPAGDATDAQLLLDRRRFTSRPLRDWNPHIPIDFQTIVLKAIAEFPHERYATAQKLADDLNRFLEGRPILATPPTIATRTGKWISRHRGVMFAAAAVLAFVLIGQFANTLLLMRQKGETERALATAQENLRQAHAVLERVSSSYADQLAAIPGADNVRGQMLEDTLKFYQGFEAQTAGDPALAADLALAYNRMGTLNERLRDGKQALANHEAARKIWLARLAEDPANVDFARNLALSDNNIGLLLASNGREKEAIETLERARDAQQSLLDNDRASEVLATDLATTCNNLGLVLRQTGKPTEAIEQFRAAIALEQSVVDKASDEIDNEASLRILAASFNNLGSLLDDTSPEEAAKNYHTAISLQQRLMKADKINRLYQGDLARTYNNLGFVLARGQNWHNAELCYLNAVKLQERLVQESPLAGSYTRDLAISLNNLGMVQSRDGRFDTAEATFKKAVTLQHQLLAAQPADGETLSNLGGVYNNLGLLFDGARRFADAEAAYNNAVDFQKQALAAAPHNDRARQLLSNHYANFARCLRNQKKQQAADQIVAERDLLLAGQPHPSDSTSSN
jgi:serine/threonine protein kinase/tetratricopeptide (TPR) repeat protein